MCTLSQIPHIGATSDPADDHHIWCLDVCTNLTGPAHAGQEPGADDSASADSAPEHWRQLQASLTGRAAWWERDHFGVPFREQAEATAPAAAGIIDDTAPEDEMGHPRSSQQQQQVCCQLRPSHATHSSCCCSDAMSSLPTSACSSCIRTHLFSFLCASV